MNDRYETFGYALAATVMQSSLYHQLDDKARAECDELIRRGQAPQACECDYETGMYPCKACAA